MPIYDEQMPDFYRSLKVDFNFQPITELIDAIQQLSQRIAGLEPYHSAGIWFEDYSSENGGGAISFIYWHIDKEQQTAEESLERSYDTQSIDVTLAGQATELQMLQLQSHAGRGQHDVSRLLSALSSELSKLHLETVFDITLHNVEDEDGVDRPIVRAYYKAK